MSLNSDQKKKSKNYQFTLCTLLLQAKSPAHGITLFLVEDGMPGYKKGKRLEKVGLKAQVREYAMKIYVGDVFIAYK